MSSERERHDEQHDEQQEQRQQQSQEKRQVSIGDLPANTTPDDDAVKGGLIPRAGGWNTGTDPDAAGE